MILQLGTLFAGLESGLAGLFSPVANVLKDVLTSPALGTSVINLGKEFATGLVQRELNRSSRNDLEDAIKAQLRAATNAVSPTAAIGQTAVYSGGPATGSAFAPATLLPPSIQPPQRILQTNPNFFGGQSAAAFQATRRPPDVFLSQSIPVETTNVGLGLVAPIVRGAQAVGRFAQSFGTTGRRAMAGVTAGAVALETGIGVGSQLAFPSTAFAPGLQGGFPSSGDPLRITDEVIARSQTMPQVVTGIPTGLPVRGNFQREPNGFQVQWYFWDGSGSPQPIDRGQANCLKRECIFRLNVFTGKFIKLKGKRMNPMNVRAFFRAGRRVDAGERICRKMFSEHRKTKTGTVRRKRARKKK